MNARKPTQRNVLLTSPTTNTPIYTDSEVSYEGRLTLRPAGAVLYVCQHPLDRNVPCTYFFFNFFKKHKKHNTKQKGRKKKTHT